MTLRLHELPEFSAALLIWPAEEGPRVTRGYRDFLENAPRDIGGGLLFLTAPEEEFIPASLTGQYLSGRRAIPVPGRRGEPGLDERRPT